MEHLEELLAHILRNSSQIYAANFIPSLCVLCTNNIETDIWNNSVLQNDWDLCYV